MEKTLSYIFYVENAKNTFFCSFILLFELCMTRNSGYSDDPVVNSIRARWRISHLLIHLRFHSAAFACGKSLRHFVARWRRRRRSNNGRKKPVDEVGSGLNAADGVGGHYPRNQPKRRMLWISSNILFKILLPIFQEKNSEEFFFCSNIHKIVEQNSKLC
jgi:hypothetical protein